MAEIQTIVDLRASLAQRRDNADEHVASANRVRIQLPDTDQVLHSRPVEFVLRRPAMLGIAVGVIYLVGPMRVLRLATTAAGVLQAGLSAWTAYRIAAARESGEDIFE